MKITRRQLRRLIKETIDADVDGNGIPDEQEDTMDPDDKVSMILNKIGDLLGDAYEIANSAPDHQNKGEGHAMAEIVHSVDNWHSTYGSGDW